MHLRTRAGFNQHQLCPNVSDIELTELLQQQFEQVQQLLDAQVASINMRKAVNASIGKVQKAGNDATVLLKSHGG